MANHVDYRCQRCGKYVGEDNGLIAEFKDVDGFNMSLCWILCHTCMWPLMTFVEFYTGINKKEAAEWFKRYVK